MLLLLLEVGVVTLPLDGGKLVSSLYAAFPSTFPKVDDGRDQFLNLNVTSDPVTSVTNARAPSPRPATAEELAGVTAKFEKLNIRPASLEPKKGNWAYRKTSPSPDNVPVADEPHLSDDFPNPQEPAADDGDKF